MNFIKFIFLSISLTSLSVANENLLIRKDAEESFYYEKDTIRRTNQFVLVWDFTIENNIRTSERLTEFDCQKGLYRQIAHRMFTSTSVISSDFIYKDWFKKPMPDQVTGKLYEIVCSKEIK